MWKPVRVFNKDAVPVPLTFEALGAAQAYVGRNQPGAVRIVRVTEEGSGRWWRRVACEGRQLGHLAAPARRRG